MNNVSLPESIKVKVKGKTLEIVEIPLGRYAELLKWLQKVLPKIQKEYGDFFDSRKKTVLTPAVIIDMVAANVDEVITFIKLGTGLDEKYIKNHIGGHEAYEILKAIVKVNKIEQLIGKTTGKKKR